MWLNPPYSREGTLRGMEQGDKPRSLMKLWIDRLVLEYEQGRVSVAILLTKADPKQNWFQPLWEYLLCFAPNKIKFNRPGLPPESMMFGTVFVYLGPHESRFIELFSQFGTIVKQVSSPVMTAEPPRLWESEVCSA